MASRRYSEAAAEKGSAGAAPKPTGASAVLKAEEPTEKPERAGDVLRPKATKEVPRQESAESTLRPKAAVAALKPTKGRAQPKKRAVGSRVGA